MKRLKQFLLVLGAAFAIPFLVYAGSGRLVTMTAITSPTASAASPDAMQYERFTVSVQGSNSISSGCTFKVQSRNFGGSWVDIAEYTLTQSTNIQFTGPFMELRMNFTTVSDGTWYAEMLGYKSD